MLTEVESLCQDLKSDKIQTRQKAFNKTDNLLNTRSRDLRIFLEDSTFVSYTDLFRAAHEGVLKQCLKWHETNAVVPDNDSKLLTYVKVLQKIVSEANDKDENRITARELSSKIVEVLQNKVSTKFFGQYYLQILQKNILNSRTSIAELKTNHWIDLLHQCFRLLKKDFPNINKIHVSQCLQQIIEKSSKYSHLGSEELIDFVEILEKSIFESEENHKLLTELLKVSYFCCKELSVRFRFVVCEFTENVMKFIHKIWDKNMLEDSKVILYKLMDLTLICHAPILDEDRKSQFWAKNLAEYTTQLRNFKFIIDTEIKSAGSSKYYSSSSLEINFFLKKFAARLCYVLYWDENQENTDENGEQSTKRQKINHKLAKVMEFVSKDDVNISWKWFIILGDLLYDFPKALSAEDFQPMLKLLVTFQSQMEHASQILAFTKCCFVLLKYENQFMDNYNGIVRNFCDENWNKVTESALRNCASHYKFSAEHHKLLQILIYHKKLPSTNFAMEITNFFFGNVIIKNDVTLQTLITVFENFNMDSTENSKELSLKVLNFLLEKQNVSNLKSVMLNTSKPSQDIVGRLIVICCLSKTDVVNLKKGDEFLDYFAKYLDAFNVTEYTEKIKEIIQLIQLKSNYKLLIEVENFNSVQESPENSNGDIKCIIDETILEQLPKFVTKSTKVLSESCSEDELVSFLKNSLETAGIYLNVMDQFFKYQAMNSTNWKLDKFTVKKIIPFSFQEIDRLFSQIISKYKLDLKDTNEILALLQKLFTPNLHHIVCKLVRSNELENLLNWTIQQLKNEFCSYGSCAIGKEEFEAAKSEKKIKFKAMEVLITYLNYKDVSDSNFVVEAIKTVNFEYSDNVEIHTIFHAIKLLANLKEIPNSLIAWSFINIQKLCEMYKNHNYISEEIIKLFESIFYLTSKFPDSQSDTMMMFRAYITKCYKKLYSPQHTVECLKQVKHFHRQYFHMYDQEDTPVASIYEMIIDFLTFPNFIIKLSAIKCVAFILDTNIKDSDFQNLLYGKNLQMEIYQKAPITKMLESETESNDGLKNKLALSLHFVSSIMCVNHMLRKNLIYELGRTIVSNKLSQEEGKLIFQKILVCLKCDSKSLMDDNTVLGLITYWVKNSEEFSIIPWYFTETTSIADFYQTYKNYIYLAMLKNDPAIFEDFCIQLNENIKENLSEVMPSTSAYLVPYYAKCPVTYQKNALVLDRYLNKQNITPNNLFWKKKIAEILERIFEIVYDREHFKKITKCQLSIQKEDELISKSDFDLCLKYIKAQMFASAPGEFLTICCMTRPLVSERLLTIFKAKIQNCKIKEQKMLHFMQYCLIIEYFFDYLKRKLLEKEINIKKFIIKDVVNFNCYLISAEDSNYEKINIATSYFIERFLKAILPMCADLFKPYLNLIVSTLIAVCKRPVLNYDFKIQCLKLMKILTIDHQSCLLEEISKLDDFPADEIFKELRENHLSIKYKFQEFTLIQEIDHFLAVEKRSIEALVCLRENLASKKSELRELFLDLSKSQERLDGIENSTLHNLIRVLICHVNGSDPERAIEAVKCLGEIGAYDLVRMVFNYDNTENSTVYSEISSVKSTMESAFKVMVEQLTVLLSHHDPEIFESATIAIYSLLALPSLKKFATPEITPYLTQKREDEKVFSEPENIKSFVNFLTKEEYSKYPNWIRNFCTEMFMYLNDTCSIQKISSKVTSFAEKMLPILFQILLSFTNPRINDEILRTVNFFFERHNEIQKSITESIYLNKFAIKIMLNITESIRVYQLDNQETFQSSIILNYLTISKAAHYCHAEFTAVLYAELWAQHQKDHENVAFATSLAKKDLQNTMNEAYLSIGIKEAAEVFINPAKSRLNYLQLQGDIPRMLLETDTQMNVDNDQETYRQTLLDAGLYNLAKLVPSETPQYECFWRLADWSILIEKDFESDIHCKTSDFQREFEKSHYTALKCLNNRDELGTQTSILKARKTIVQLLNRSSLECTKNLYKFMGMSQQLQQIEDFCEIQFKSSENHVKMVQKWQEQDKTSYNNFTYIEPVLAQRNCILSTAAIKAGKRTWVPGVLQKNFLFMIKQARESEDFQNIALRNIARMKSLGKDLIPECEAELVLEDAQISWKLNDKNLSKNLLIRVIKEKQFANLLQKSVGYKLYGEYAAQTYSEDISDINNNYFMRSVKMLEKHAEITGNSEVLNTNSQRNFEVINPEMEKINEYLSIHETVAKYYDREYNEICEHMKNPTYQKKVQDLSKNDQAIKKLMEEIKSSATGSVRKDKQQSYAILERNKRNDKAEIEAMEGRKNQAATNAAINFVRYSILDPSMNLLSIFRIVSLWLNNQNNESIQVLLEKRSECISSHKFINALPQLSSRINESNEATRRTLHSLLERCAKEHPHHTLNYLLAFYNSNLDSTETNSEIEARKKLALKIISNLRKDQEMTKILAQYQEMSVALINFANVDNVSEIPKNDPILKIKNFVLVQCPTLVLPISPKHDYRDIISIVKWDEQMSLVGGINSPKKLGCLCSDGIMRPQLLKSKDDLRQDAVMQQVFNIMNGIFRDNKETKRHDLNIRTYKVLPLSRRSGILEWCQNCIPIGKYLIHDNAHARYRPKDWPYSKCLLTMDSIDRIDQKTKLEKFQEIFDNFQPVFHHFFLENFLMPGMWFESRLKYIKSVATTSMVGYILGIGDRHVQNIMIDKLTGEVVHIDFGIAFEQGKILPHPEKIPFRLTRDILAPFGVCGVNGIFRKLCEKILIMLRENEPIIMTILEVLLYDPLYAWTMTSSKAKKYQDESVNLTEEPEKNTTASRALLRVEAKLRGQDDRTGYSSIEGQVERLFQEAMSRVNLANLYKGWQPYI